MLILNRRTCRHCGEPYVPKNAWLIATWRNSLFEGLCPSCRTDAEEETERDTDKIVEALRASECSPPPWWEPLIRLAQTVGLKLHGVPSAAFCGLDIGDSPGRCWAYAGECWIGVGEAEEDIVHEIAHFVWAFNRGQGQHLAVNYDCDQWTDEGRACDLELIWHLAHWPIYLVVDRAETLSFSDNGETLRQTVELATAAWQKAGMELVFDEVKLQALAESWGVSDANQRWNDRRAWGM